MSHIRSFGVTGLLACVALGAVVASGARPAEADPTRSGELRVRVSRDDLAPQGRFTLRFLDASGVELGASTAVFRAGIPMGSSRIATLVLDRDVEPAAVRSIAVRFTPAGRDSVQVTHLAVRLGTAYPHVQLLDEWFPSPYRPVEERTFPATSVPEGDLALTALHIQGEMIDSARLTDTDVRFLVELTDGRMLRLGRPPNAPLANPIHDGGFFEASAPLPVPIRRSQVRRLRIFYGIDPAHRQLSFTDFFLEPDDMRMRNVRLIGEGETGRYYSIGHWPAIALEDYAMFEGEELTPGASVAVLAYRPEWFNVWVMTGGDDLRWDPAAAPNMECEVRLVLRDGTVVPLVTRALAPTAPFARGGVWGGGFGNYQTAERMARWQGAGAPPLLQDIVAVELHAVRGWNAGRVRGVEPSRQPDEWHVRGIWVGAAAAIPAPSYGERGSPHDGWHTVACKFDVNRKLRLGESVSLPVRIAAAPPFEALRRVPLRPAGR